MLRPGCYGPLFFPPSCWLSFSRQVISKASLSTGACLLSLHSFWTHVLPTEMFHIDYPWPIQMRLALQAKIAMSAPGRKTTNPNHEMVL